MTPDRMQPWWQDLEAGIEAADLSERSLEGDELPDPWAERDSGELATLTPDQEAFLRGLADQPPVVRLSGAEPLGSTERSEGTGNLPGDS